jgi:hypothetical protein
MTESGARAAIQQRATSNLLVTFATDITSTQRQAIQIEYKFNPKWSVSGTRNQNGGFGVEREIGNIFGFLISVAPLQTA